MFFCLFGNWKAFKILNSNCHQASIISTAWDWVGHFLIPMWHLEVQGERPKRRVNQTQRSREWWEEELHTKACSSTIEVINIQWILSMVNRFSCQGRHRMYSAKTFHLFSYHKFQHRKLDNAPACLTLLWLQLRDKAKIKQKVLWKLKIPSFEFVPLSAWGS